MHEVRGRLGQRYLLCESAAVEAKYPRQPVVACGAHQPVEPGEESANGQTSEP